MKNHSQNAPTNLPLPSICRPLSPSRVLLRSPQSPAAQARHHDFLAEANPKPALQPLGGLLLRRRRHAGPSAVPPPHRRPRHPPPRLARAPPPRIPWRRLRQGQHPHGSLRSLPLAAPRRRLSAMPLRFPWQNRRLQQLSWCDFIFLRFFGVIYLLLFDGFVLVLGLCQYDPDGTEAKALEEAIEGIHVIRHGK